MVHAFVAKSEIVSHESNTCHRPVAQRSCIDNADPSHGHSHSAARIELIELASHLTNFLNLVDRFRHNQFRALRTLGD